MISAAVWALKQRQTELNYAFKPPCDPFHVGPRAMALSVICSSQIYTFGGLDVPLKHSKQQIQIMWNRPVVPVVCCWCSSMHSKNKATTTVGALCLNVFCSVHRRQHCSQCCSEHSTRAWVIVELEKLLRIGESALNICWLSGTK